MKTIVTAQPATMKDGSKNPNAGKIFTLSVDKDGKVKLDKNNKRYGYIRVESQELSLGFAYANGGVKKRSVLIPMTEDGWNNCKDAYSHGTEVSGKIVRHDSLTASYPGQKPLQTSDGVAITANGQPVYRTERYTEVASEVDTKEGFEAFDVIETVVASKKAAVVA